MSTEVSALMETLGESMLLPQVHQTALITQMIVFSVTVLVCEKQMLTYMLSQEIAFPIIRLLTLKI